jgi:hypothetical protein
MIDTIHRRRCQVMRIHAAGDFDRVDYVRTWGKIIAACPDTVFFSYTRSWRVKRLQRAIEYLATLTNHHLWYSTDRDTGPPARVPRRVRTCYMITEGETAPPWTVDLVFRDEDHLKGEIVKKINGMLVCPYEQGTNINITCSQCKYCFRERISGRNAA